MSDLCSIACVNKSVSDAAYRMCCWLTVRTRFSLQPTTHDIICMRRILINSDYVTGFRDLHSARVV